jgi:ribosome-associated protein
MSHETEDEQEHNERPSKSQLKREAEALQQLGEELVELPPARLEKFPLPEHLHKAIRECQQIRQRGGRKRQLQYIGRLMRELDAEPIREAMARLHNRHAEDNAHFHRLEKWRDRLLSEGDAAVEELLQEQPEADRQQLRQLIRNSQREQAAGKPPRSARALFRYLRELYEE